MTDLRIPRSVDDITPEWLSDALRTAPSAPRSTISTVVSERIGEGIGIMGELWRLRVSYEVPHPGLPSTLVAKLPSPFPENRAHGVNLGLYEAETRFYRDLVGTTATRTPHCYLALKDPDSADFVIIMEDLSGLRMIDQREGMSDDEVRQAVMALAELHGSWWGKLDEETHGWVPSLTHPRIEAMGALWPELWPTFVSRFGASLPQGGEAIGERVRDNYWPLMQRLAQQPSTLLHMDFRCENLLFDAAASSRGVVVLDWQSLGRGAAAYDLAYLLGGSLRIDDRRRTEKSMLGLYYDVVSAMGVGDYSFTALWDAYCFAHLVAGTATAVLTGASTDLANERGTELIRTMTERHFTAAVDLAGGHLDP